MGMILGLDLGSNSIGWALYDNDNKSIIDMGSRVYDNGVNDYGKSGETSKRAFKAQKKRERRQLNRKKARRRKLIAFLETHKILNNNNKNDFFIQDPYYLRKKALDELLSQFELGRVLFHFAKRRGFKSNRKADNPDEKGKIFSDKDGTIGINTTREKMSEFRTLGEYLYSLNPHEQRIRSRYTERKMYFEEFNLIIKTQKELENQFLTDEIIKDLDDIIFYQNPLKSQKDKVGKCTFEKNKKRIRKSHPFAQEFRYIQVVNTLKINTKTRVYDEQSILSENERKYLIEYLAINEELKLDKKDNYKLLKKVLKIDNEIQIQVNLTMTKLKGNTTFARIRKALGDVKFNKLYLEYLAQTDKTQSDLYKIYHNVDKVESEDDTEKLLNYFTVIKKFTVDEAKKLSDLTFEDKYLNVCEKVVKKLLNVWKDEPELGYAEACQKAGFHHSQKEDVEIMDFLPNPPSIANPVVRTGLNELRKVVNDIILNYRRPDSIRIEMARDLKKPLEDRIEESKRQNAMQTENDRIREKLKSEYIVKEPTRLDIIKYRLWEESNHTCPYSGRKIPLNILFKEGGEVEIEHILPYSRTLNNSFNNLTLSYRDENAFKGNRTPYEAYSADEFKYNQIIDRVKEFKNLAKYRKFVKKELDAGFNSQQLNDTRYISVLAKDYLRHLTDVVETTNGNLTSTLTYLWGLKSILRDDEQNIKNREDHRHHAIDALVIAITNQSMVQRLSKYNRINGKVYYDDEKLSEKYPLPWATFRDDVKAAVNNIIVSHKFKKKASGQLHENTLYGKMLNEHKEQKKDLKGQNLYAIRKPILSLTPNEIMQIADKNIRKIVLDRLVEFGVNTSNNKFTIPKEAFKEPLYIVSLNGLSKTKINTIRVHKPFNNIRQIRNEKTYVEPGNNHHIEIYADENGKKYGNVVSLLDVMKRKNNGEPIIKKDWDAGKDFIMSLKVNEMILNTLEAPVNFDKKDKSTYHTIFDITYRVQNMTESTQVFFKLHNIAVLESKDKNGNKVLTPSLSKVPSTLIANKIKVSPAGFIEFAND